MHDNIKNVVITGGAKGIGQGISKKFLENGYNVYIISRNKPEDFEQSLSGAIFVEGDVTNKESIENAINVVEQKCSKIDVLVNNAGHSFWKSVDNIDEEFWQKMLGVNLSGVFWTSRACVENMKKNDGGVIVNIASMAGKRGSVNNCAYNAAKFGVVGMTQSMCKELGQYNIRINSICPVYIKTDGLVDVLNGEHPDIGDLEVDEFLNNWAKNNSPLGRTPTIEECAEFCLFLASDKSSAINGQNINLDCGVVPQ